MFFILFSSLSCISGFLYLHHFNRAVDTALNTFIPKQRRGVFLCINGINPWGAAPCLFLDSETRGGKTSHHCHGNGLAFTSRDCNVKILWPDGVAGLSIPEFLTIGRNRRHIAAPGSQGWRHTEDGVFYMCGYIFSSSISRFPLRSTTPKYRP